MERIAILTGGDSEEYEISLLSAKTVQKHLKKEKYIGTLVHLKNGNYTVKKNKINTEDFSYFEKNQRIKFDKVFIVIHGSPAEDGLIQEYFEKIKLPYTSCNSIVSSLTFNKFKCNNELKKLGFTCAKSVLINKTQSLKINNIVEEIGLPCMVKPNKSGSSYGVSIAKNNKELKESINYAYKFDNEIIIECFVKGMEVSCGVFIKSNQIITLPITEIVSKNDFFDYEAKYNGEASEITPARISRNLYLEIQNISKKIYLKMKLQGVCRIDFIIKNNNPHIIEINTIPGLSEKSIIPQQIKAFNMTLSDFFDVCLSNIN